MDEKEEPQLEYWELPEKPEGFDVYGYDARRALIGQMVTAAIFLIALAVFAKAIWSMSHSTRVEDEPVRTVRTHQ